MSSKSFFVKLSASLCFIGGSFALAGAHVSSTNQQNKRTTDTAKVCFETDVLPIFKNKCANAHCHDAKSAEDGVILDSYSNTMKTLRLSSATDPLRNKLRGVISRNKMPPIKHDPLTDAEKNMVYQWLQQGMKNDPCSFIWAPAPTDTTH